MKRDTGCNVIDHLISRRNLLLGATAAAGFGPLVSPLLAGRLRRKRKQILQVYLQGGVSQFVLISGGGNVGREGLEWH